MTVNDVYKPLPRRQDDRVSRFGDFWNNDESNNDSATINCAFRLWLTFLLLLKI